MYVLLHGHILQFNPDAMTVIVNGLTFNNIPQLK